jgi:hypothetical protein
MIALIMMISAVRFLAIVCSAILHIPPEGGTNLTTAEPVFGSRMKTSIASAIMDRAALTLKPQNRVTRPRHPVAPRSSTLRG